MSKMFKDITGLKSGRLEAVSHSHKSKNNGNMWHCICECGNKTIVGESALKGGHTLSCGCLRRDSSRANAKHGMTGTTIYRRWTAMKQRCTNPKSVNFEIYGGRGITYDPRWENFENFFEDMAEGFRDDLELDRIDVNGNYCKENCRWTTHSENNFNKTTQVNNVSGKTGVSFRQEIGKYRAYITFKGRQISLGVFSNIEEAIQARKEAELKYYGYNRD